MHLSLPDTLQPYIEAGVAAGRFKSAEAYVTALIEQEQEQRDIAKLKNLLDEARSEPPIPVTPEFWDDIRHQVRQHSNNQ